MQQAEEDLLDKFIAQSTTDVEVSIYCVPLLLMFINQFYELSHVAFSWTCVVGTLNWTL